MLCPVVQCLHRASFWVMHGRLHFYCCQESSAFLFHCSLSFVHSTWDIIRAHVGKHAQIWILKDGNLGKTKEAVCVQSHLFPAGTQLLVHVFCHTPQSGHATSILLRGAGVQKHIALLFVGQFCCRFRRFLEDEMRFPTIWAHLNLIASWCHNFCKCLQKFWKIFKT